MAGCRVEVLLLALPRSRTGAGDGTGRARSAALGHGHPVDPGVQDADGHGVLARRGGRPRALRLGGGDGVRATGHPAHVSPFGNINRRSVNFSILA